MQSNLKTLFYKRLRMLSIVIASLIGLAVTLWYKAFVINDYIFIDAMLILFVGGICVAGLFGYDLYKIKKGSPFIGGPNW
jgi:hypothetical protein